MRKLITLVGLGAALRYFLDSSSGAARRAQARERVLGFLRQRGVMGQSGAGSTTDEPDDATPARKVETEIVRDPEVPKGGSTSMPRTASSSSAARSSGPS